MKLWLIRIVLLLVGLTIAHLGVTLFLQADMGSDPFNVLIQGLYRFFPWPSFITHGTVHVIISFLIILPLLLMLGGRAAVSVFAGKDAVMYLVCTVLSCIAESSLLVVGGIFVLGVILLIVNAIVRKAQRKRCA